MTISKATATPKAPETESKPDNLTPATTVAASGAIVEPEILERIDTDHPSVDNNPRAGASEASNQIDFNDPTLTDEEAVTKNLGVDLEKRAAESDAGSKK